LVSFSLRAAGFAPRHLNRCALRVIFELVIMKPISCSILFFILLLLSAGFCLAQDNEPIQKEWLAKDTEALKLLSKVTPVENQTFESLEKILGEPTDQEDRGFGARTFTFSKGNGYTHFSVTAFTFNNSVIHYNVGVGSSSKSWQRIKPIIIGAWKQNSILEFKESDSGIYYERNFPEVLEAYKDAVSNELGKMKPVSVPANLKEAYENLISPTRNSVVGSGGCGYGGVTPQGKEDIDLIVAAKQVDLLENILRGYNAGGRVYAVLALLEMEKRGLKLSEDAQNGIRKISNLTIKIETCSGCMFTYRTAKEILSKPDSF
jgi:hypothetical protein